MSKAITAALREAAKANIVHYNIGDSIDRSNIIGELAFYYAHEIIGSARFAELSNEERSAFLYLCSLIAEDYHG